MIDRTSLKAVIKKVTFKELSETFICSPLVLFFAVYASFWERNSWSSTFTCLLGKFFSGWEELIPHVWQDSIALDLS